MKGTPDLDIRIRIERRTLVGIMVSALLFGAGIAISETLTMTTYYPSPSGVYRKLVSTAQTFLARDGGNVGIGTSTPANKLSVAGGNAEFGGRVGIGTNAPQAPLDVRGEIRTTGGVVTGQEYLEVNANGSGNRNAYVDLHGDDTYWDYGLRVIRGNGGPNTYAGIFNRGSGPLYLQSQDGGHVLVYSQAGGTVQLNSQGWGGLQMITGGNLGMYINSAGNVGLGTWGPWTKLDVNGRVRITDGTQSNGRVLTSDWNGVASWQPPSTGRVGPPVYQCPSISGGSLGGGKWGFYGCHGGFSSLSRCLVVEWPNSRWFNCSNIGRLLLQ
jgi:hypothetical protein